MYNVYLRYLHLRNNSGKNYDWYDMASAVRRELPLDNEERRYRHVIIDEGQDFSPEMIRSLTGSIPPNGSVTFLGDMVQQIFGQRMSWRSAGLRPSKIWRFEHNYRNTKQVSKLALALAKMPDFPDSPDLVEPKEPIADGQLPVLAKLRNKSEETALIVSKAAEMSKTSSVAILFRSNVQITAIEPHLPKKKTKLHRELRQWPGGPGLFYGTYHSAKGLEFDVVFLPFLTSEYWPNPKNIKVFGLQEASERDSRLLYVGITRSRSILALTYSGEVTSLLPKDESLYHRI